MTVKQFYLMQFGCGGLWLIIVLGFWALVAAALLRFLGVI